MCHKCGGQQILIEGLGLLSTLGGIGAVLGVGGGT